MRPTSPICHSGRILKQTKTAGWGCDSACHARISSADRHIMGIKQMCDPNAGPGLVDRKRNVTTLNNGEAGTEEEDHWLYFGLDDDEIVEYTALRDDIPEWLETSLWDWIRRAFTITTYGQSGPIRQTATNWFDNELLRKCERKLRVPVAFNQPNSMEVAKAINSIRLAYRDRTDRDIWRLVNYLLRAGHTRGETLKTYLLDAGSAWTVADADEGHCYLARRVPDGMKAAAEAASQKPNGGKRLAIAWEDAFGVNPDPSKAYWFAVKAVEDASARVVIPNDPSPTLGKVISRIEQGEQFSLPHLREDSRAKTHDILLGMLRMIWVGQYDRHGGMPQSPLPDDVTQAEAEAAVMAAVTLVGWFETGKVQP